MKKGSFEEQVLRASKEIVVKFIETGRVSPTGFPDTFRIVYEAVHDTAKAHAADAAPPAEEGPS